MVIRWVLEIYEVSDITLCWHLHIVSFYLRIAIAMEPVDGIWDLGKASESMKFVQT